MVENFRDMLQRSWGFVAQQTAEFVPKLLAGILILVLGFLIARLVRGITARFFLAIRLDRMSDRLGITAFLARGDVRYTVAEILATTIYWLVLIVSFQVLALTLGLEGMAAFCGQVLAYVPRLLVALVIVLIGIAFGFFFGEAVQVAASNAQFPAARPVGATVKTLIGFFAFAIALEELEIASELFVTTMEIVVAAAAFALALAFGLGCKDLAGKAVQGWLDRARSQPPTQADS
ncbi:MAG: hypothetical protein ABIG68_09125 [Acidobacteriota bacterium]